MLVGVQVTVIQDRGCLQNQWEKRVRRKTQERWRELQEGGEEDVQREGGEVEEEGEEKGEVEDEEERYLLWINLTGQRLAQEQKFITDTPVTTALQHFHRVEYSSDMAISPFTGPTPGLAIPVSCDPLELFYAFFDDTLIGLIVTETNKYAKLNR